MNEDKITSAFDVDGRTPSQPTVTDVNGNGDLSPTGPSSVQCEREAPIWAVLGKNGVVMAGVSYQKADDYVRENNHTDKDLTILAARAAANFRHKDTETVPENWTEIQQSIK